MPQSLPPYYHPTMVCFVDDNYSFLRSLAVDLPEHISFISYLDPETALAAINKPDPVPPLVDRCFSMDNSDPTAPVIHLNLAVLEQEIKLVERFRRVSVLMVDYAMPTMDGLEFCAQVRDKDILKALLTGVADEKTAVAAFNRGIIDRYIPKADLEAISSLIPYVENLKRAYFEQYTTRLRTNLALNPPVFMTDPQVIANFHEVIDRFEIVEYYLVGDPYGYLMLRADGSMVRWVVLSEQELEAQIQLAQTHQAPQEVLNGLRRGEQIGYLSERPEDYLGHEPYPWHEMLLPAKEIKSSNTWFVAVAEHPPRDIDFDPQQTSYNKFLQLERPLV